MKNNLIYRRISIVLLLVLVVVLIKERYPERLLNKVSAKQDIIETKSYLSTDEYKHELGLYGIYEKKGSIVMLGNSITYRVDWNELLNRDDVINRGIGHDITQGFIDRINTVLEVEPEMCFVMGGINDIVKGIDVESIINNLQTLSRLLEENQVKPFIYSIINVAEDYPKQEQINIKVNQVNAAMKQYCAEHSIRFIDLNATLTDNGSLMTKYSFDGIHLTADAYGQWRDIILPIINSHIELEKAESFK